jgi:acid phosphatase class B
LTQNNQTPYKSQQSLVDVQWGKNLYQNALLNTRLRSEKPVRWSGDKRYKAAGKTTITYSFISKNSILGYGDDVNDIIQPRDDLAQNRSLIFAKYLIIWRHM